MPTEPFYIEAVIVQATNATSNDGYHQCWFNGVSQGSDTGLDNYDQFNAINGEFRMGADDLGANTTGTLYVDDFIVRDDTTEIGAAPSGVDVTPAAASAGADSVDPEVLIPITVYVDFEEGDFTDMPSTSSDVDGDHTVTAGSAIIGSYGSQAVFNDGTNPAWHSTALTGSNYPDYIRARIYIDATNMSFVSGEYFYFFWTHINGWTQANLFALQIAYNASANTVTLRGEYTDDADSSWFTISGLNNLAVTQNVPHWIELLLVRPSSSVASDGTIDVWVDGAAQTQTTGIDNYDKFITQDRFSVGIGSRSYSSGGGTLYIDDIIINNFNTEIGPDRNITPAAATAGTDAIRKWIFPFKDGFESGDTSAWDSVNGTPSINGTAAIDGSYGYEVAYNDTSYVVAEWVNSTNRLVRVKFKVDPNSIVGDTADSIRIVDIYDGATRIFSVTMRQSPTTHDIFISGNGFTAQSALISDAPHTVEVQVTFGVGDAEYRWWIDDVEKSGDSSATSDFYPDEVRFGFNVSSSPFNSGSFYLDSFELYDIAKGVDVTPAAATAGTDATRKWLFPFKDGFESGDTSAWDAVNGTPTINGTAAIDGSYGFEIPYNHSGQIFTEIQWTNTTQQVYRVKFKFDVSTITHSSGDWETLVQMGDGGASGDSVVAIELQESGGSLVIKTYMADDAHVWDSGVESSAVTGEHTYEAEFHFVNESGYAYIWLDGVPQTGITGRDTGEHYPDFLRFGTYFSNTGYEFDSGSIYLDSFILSEDVRGVDVTPAAASAATAVKVTLGEIFHITFEGGDTSEFDSLVDGADLAATTAAALVGDYGLAGTVDDTTGSYGVIGFTGPESGIIRYRFYFDPNGITHDTSYTVFTRLNCGALPWSLGVVAITYTGGNYQIRVQHVNDDATWENSINNVIVSDGPHAIEVRTTRSTTSTSFDGTITVWIDGQLVTPTAAADNIDNYDAWDSLENIRLGAMTTAYPNVDGVLYLDDYIVRDDDTPIGIVVEPAPAVAGADSVDPTVTGGGGTYAQVSWANMALPSVDDIDVAPTAVSASADSVNPTTQLGSISLTPTAGAAGADSINPSVTLGSVSVTPSPDSAGADSVGPTVEQDSLNISPTLVSSGADSVNPTVQLGSISVTTSPASSTAVSVDPSVIFSSVSSTPDPSVAGADSTGPTVQLGSVSVSPTLVEAGADSVNPSVELGDISITPDPAVAGADSIDPSLYWGSTNSTPDPAVAGADSVDPTVFIGGGTTYVYPDAVVAGADSVSPTTRLGSISFGPTAASAAADSVNPSVELGDISITPTLVSATATKTDPTVQLGDVSVTPTGGTSTASTVAPTVELGDLSITPTAVAAGADSVNPTVTITDPDVWAQISWANMALPAAEAAINIYPAAVTAGADSVNPTVQLGSISYGPTEVSAGADSINPTVLLGNISITPNAAVAGADSIDPSVEQDSLNISTSPASASADSVDPSVGQDSLNVSTTPVAASADSVGPTVRLGSISVSTTPSAAGADSVDPTVDISSGDVNVYPAEATAGADSVNPTVRLGSVSVTPSAAVAGADSVDPTVEAGADVNVYPTAITAGADSVGPTVRLGSISITPTLADAGADSVNPTTEQGDLNISPTLADAGADSFFAETRLGSINITPSAAVAGADSVDPTVDISSGDVNVTPTAASAGADSVLGQVYFSSTSATPAASTAATDGVDPEVVQDSMDVTPSASSASADSVDPTVRQASLSLTTTPAASSAVGVDPTVQSGGDLNITPSAVVASADAVAPTVRQGSLDLTPTLSSAGAVSTVGEIRQDSVNVTPSPAAAACSGVDPEVPIYIPVFPAAATAGADSVGPSLFWGSQSASPDEAFARTSVSGSVTGGEVLSLSPAVAGTDALVEVQGGNNRLYVSFVRFLAPLGSDLQVYPAPASASASTTDPSVNFSSDSATPSAASASTSVSGPSITTGDINITPSAASASVDAVGPSVKQSSQNVTSDEAVAGTDTVNPTFQYGSIDITPNPRLVRAVSVPPLVSDLTVPTLPAVAGTDAVGPSAVRQGSFSRTPAPASAASSVVGPTLHWGSQSATPGAASAATETTGPQVEFGDIDVTTSPASTAASTTSPAVGLSSVSVTISVPASARASVRIGAVREGGGYLYVYPVESYAQGVTNIGQVRISGYFAVVPDPATAGTRIHPVKVQITGGSIEVYPVEAEAEAKATQGAIHTGDLDMYPTEVGAGTGSSIGEVRQSSLWRYPAERAARALGIDPEVTLGSISITPTPASAGTRSLHQWTRQTSLNLAPAASTASVASVAPTILFQGGYTAVGPSPAVSGADSVNPQVLYGSVSITNSKASAAASVGIGLILQFSSTDVYPNAGTAKTRTVGPMVRQLAMNLYPVAVSAGTDASGTVQMGDYVLYPKFVFTRTRGANPTVQLGDLDVTPTAASAATSVASSLGLSSMSLSPDPAIAIVASVLGEYLVLDNLYPNLDLAVGAWTDEDGNVTGLFDSIDERPIPSDVDYIMNETPENEVYRADFTEGADPGRDDHHIVEYRIRKDSVLTRIDITVTLKQGDTTIASWTHQDIGTDYVTISQTLTTGQAALITDYSQLRLEFNATEV